jgi:hypothetical protein
MLLESSCHPVSWPSKSEGSLGRFSGWRLLQYRSGRPTDTSKYSADLQAAISLRTDRTDKTVADIRTIVQKQS